MGSLSNEKSPSEDSSSLLAARSLILSTAFVTGKFLERPPETSRPPVPPSLMLPHSIVERRTPPASRPSFRRQSNRGQPEMNGRNFSVRPLPSLMSGHQDYPNYVGLKPAHHHYAFSGSRRVTRYSSNDHPFEGNPPESHPRKVGDPQQRSVVGDESYCLSRDGSRSSPTVRVGVTEERGYTLPVTSKMACRSRETSPFSEARSLELPSSSGDESSEDAQGEVLRMADDVHDNRWPLSASARGNQPFSRRSASEPSMTHAPTRTPSNSQTPASSKEDSSSASDGCERNGNRERTSSLRPMDGSVEAVPTSARDQDSSRQRSTAPRGRSSNAGSGRRYNYSNARRFDQYPNKNFHNNRGNLGYGYGQPHYTGYPPRYSYAEQGLARVSFYIQPPGKHSAQLPIATKLQEDPLRILHEHIGVGHCRRDLPIPHYWYGTSVVQPHNGQGLAFPVPVDVVSFTYVDPCHSVNTRAASTAGTSAFAGSEISSRCVSPSGGESGTSEAHSSVDLHEDFPEKSIHKKEMQGTDSPASEDSLDGLRRRPKGLEIPQLQCASFLAAPLIPFPVHRMMCHAPMSEEDTAIYNIYTRYRQTSDTRKLKDRVQAEISCVLQTFLPLHKVDFIGVFTVGSTITGVAREDSDLDLCLMIKMGDIDQRIVGQPVLRRAKFVLEQERHIQVTNLDLLEARIPILKFRDRASGIKVDLNCNNYVGIQNSTLLQCYGDLDWRVRPLVFVIKLWASRKRINNPSANTLSSYSFCLMVIFYLQSTSPAVLPCLHSMHPDHFDGRREPPAFVSPVAIKQICDPIPVSGNKQSLVSLLKGFFAFYSKFDFFRNVISVREGKCLSLSACRSRNTPKNTFEQWGYINIEEPFHFTNASRAVYEHRTYSRIKEHLEQAASLLNSSDFGVETLEVLLEKAVS